MASFDHASWWATGHALIVDGSRIVKWPQLIASCSWSVRFHSLPTDWESCSKLWHPASLMFGNQEQQRQWTSPLPSDLILSWSALGTAASFTASGEIFLCVWCVGRTANVGSLQGTHCHPLFSDNPRSFAVRTLYPLSTSESRTEWAPLLPCLSTQVWSHFDTVPIVLVLVFSYHPKWTLPSITISITINHYWFLYIVMI